MPDDRPDTRTPAIDRLSPDKRDAFLDAVARGLLEGVLRELAAEGAADQGGDEQHEQRAPIPQRRRA